MDGRFVSVNGCNTYYLDEGSGPTIVLLHGASLAIDAYSTWHATIAALSRSFRVIAFDQIGFGRTDMPGDGRYVNRLHRVDHALAFLDRVGVERAHIVGHSEGGFMATRMAIVRQSLVTKLVIVASGATAPRLGGELDHGWMKASRSAYDYSGGVGTEDDFVITNSSLSTMRDDKFETVLRENYRRASAAGQLDMFQRLPEAETDPALYVELQERYIHPHLSTLTVPTLLIWASGDPTVPVERAVALMRSIPNADLHVFKHASHMVMLDRADAFNSLLASWCSDSDGAPRHTESRN